MAEIPVGDEQAFDLDEEMATCEATLESLLTMTLEEDNPWRNAVLQQATMLIESYADDLQYRKEREG